MNSSSSSFRSSCLAYVPTATVKAGPPLLETQKRSNLVTSSQSTPLPNSSNMNSRSNNTSRNSSIHNQDNSSINSRPRMASHLYRQYSNLTNLQLAHHHSNIPPRRKARRRSSSINSQLLITQSQLHRMATQRLQQVDKRAYGFEEYNSILSRSTVVAQQCLIGWIEQYHSAGWSMTLKISTYFRYHVLGQCNSLLHDQVFLQKFVTANGSWRVIPHFLPLAGRLIATK